MGLAGAYAVWLAKSGAEHLVLTSRRGDEHPEAASLKTELEALGARVTVARVDLTAPDQVAALVAQLRNWEPPLRAVFHLAAVLDDAFLVNQTHETFQTVWRPKAFAARLLDLATRDISLDVFVLFSSAASLLGNFGIANYALANAYLDGLAAERHGVGLPALSINWGTWAGPGLNAKVNRAHRDAEKNLECARWRLQSHFQLSHGCSRRRLPRRSSPTSGRRTDAQTCAPLRRTIHILAELLAGVDETSANEITGKRTAQEPGQSVRG